MGICDMEFMPDFIVARGTRARDEINNFCFL